jgi:hypothetical protein
MDVSHHGQPYLNRNSVRIPRVLLRGASKKRLLFVRALFLHFTSDFGNSTPGRRMDSLAKQIKNVILVTEQSKTMLGRKDRVPDGTDFSV